MNSSATRSFASLLRLPCNPLSRGGFRLPASIAVAWASTMVAKWYAMDTPRYKGTFFRGAAWANVEWNDSMLLLVVGYDAMMSSGLTCVMTDSMIRCARAFHHVVQFTAAGNYFSIFATTWSADNTPPSATKGAVCHLKARFLNSLRLDSSVCT